MNAFYSIPSITGRTLAKRLNIPFYKQSPNRPIHTVINWGRTYIPFTKQRVLNKPSAVYKASNKQLCRLILQHAGIPVPEFGINTFPCVGRPMKHSAGKNFFLCNNIEDVIQAHKKGAVYFSAYYPKEKEYRIHCTPEKIIAGAEKKNGDTAQPAWNHNADFFFRYIPRLLIPATVRSAARHAVGALGLNFGACDIGYKDGKAVVLK